MLVQLDEAADLLELLGGQVDLGPLRALAHAAACPALLELGLLGLELGAAVLVELRSARGGPLQQQSGNDEADATARHRVAAISQRLRVSQSARH